MCKFRIFTVFIMLLATEEEVRVLWNMFYKIKSIVFKIKILTCLLLARSFGNGNGNYILHWCLIQTFKVLFVIGNFLDYSCYLYTFWACFLSDFFFFNILKLPENNLTSCESKESVRRKLKCISTLRNLSWDF